MKRSRLFSVDVVLGMWLFQIDLRRVYMFRILTQVCHVSVGLALASVLISFQALKVSITIWSWSWSILHVC